MKENRLPLFRANMTLFVIIVLGIMILLNYLSYKHNIRFDTTASKKYSISEQTIKILDSLPVDLQMFFFDKPSTEERIEAESLLSEYIYYSDRVSVEYIDPDQQPAITQKYGVQRYGTLVLKLGEKQQHVEKVSEQTVTNAILKLTKGASKSIYFLAGHGETDIDAEDKNGYSLVKQSLESQNYKVQKLVLMRNPQIPADCELLILASPKTELMKEEQTAIENYLASGGSGLFLIDPPQKDKQWAGAGDFLAKYGIRLGNNMVIDTMSQLFAGNYFMPVITMYGDNPITRDFKLASFFPVARSVSLAENAPDNVKLDILGSTGGENSWAESDMDGPYEYTEGKDVKGPIIIAVAAEITLPAKTSQTESAEKKNIKRIQTIRKKTLLKGGWLFLAILILPAIHISIYPVIVIYS